MLKVIMKILLTFFVLFFSSFVIADDASEFEIEGISLGDSLLEYISKEEINNQYQETKFYYDYLPEKFGEVYLYEGLEQFDYLSFFYKLKDKKYTIHSIRGVLAFKNINECINKQKELSAFVYNMFPNAIYDEYIHDHPVDESGNSKNHVMIYTNEDNKFSIMIHCTDFEENLRIKNNWDDGLSFSIDTQEVVLWLENY